MGRGWLNVREGMGVVARGLINLLENVGNCMKYHKIK